VDIHQDDNTLYAIYIGRLIFKEAGGQVLTEKELADLTIWRESTAHRKQLSGQLQDRSAVANEIRRLNNEYDADDAVYKIFGRLNLDLRPLKEKAHLALMWRRSISAAAAVLFILIGVWYFGTRSKEGPPIGSSSGQHQNDIKPGSNKAILTLADGRRIVLDSARNGQLAQQGNVKVVESHGQLSYETGNKGGEVVYNMMTTPRGGQYQLVLPDGTKVWLNAASSIRYPTFFSGANREVELTGEGYFEVAPNKSRPFIVKAGNMNVTVLGTHFDIMAYEDEENRRATLLEGKIMVGKGTDEKIIAPGQQAIVNNNRPVIIDKNADIDKAVAWKTGFFKFNDTDIKTLMREISRWYDIEVVYNITDFSGEFGGRISRKLNLSELVKLLQGNGIYHYRIENRKLIVLP
jgi:ferric-dicitrate binding protein FerR (iron transport regulator)